MANTLIPSYLDIDFNTLVSRIKEELQDSPIFRDYNYEGSNIAVLIELLAYIGELNTYFLNKVAKNVYLETADVYENIHRLARQVGYEPKGHLPAKATLTVGVTGGAGSYHSPGQQLYVPAWHQISSTESYDGETIQFATTEATTIDVSTSASFTFDLPVVQGVVTTLTGYKGKDLVDNTLIIPTYDYAYEDPEDEIPVIEVKVNDEPWTRISDFYDEISALADVSNVYMFVYDKYEMSTIVFNSARNVPEDDDDIEITLLKTFGSNGAVGVRTITTPDANLIKNITTDTYLPSNMYSVENSAATLGSDVPETISEIRENAKGIMHAQYRTVAAADYISFLQENSTVTRANVWGEQEVSPSGNVELYNRVYISVIPQRWGSDTISTTPSAWYPTPGVSGSILVPTAYSSTYTDNLKTYLEPRKILTTYEVFHVPELVYFNFEIGLRLKRLYNFTDVQEDVKDKLEYYFRTTAREFGETINFLDIMEYLIDTTETSPTNTFDNIKGIRNLTIRDIEVSTTTYEPSATGVWQYPRYTETRWTGDNLLRPIDLGRDQFPVLSTDTLTFVEET